MSKKVQILEIVIVVVFILLGYWFFSPKMTLARTFCKQNTTDSVYLVGKYVQVVSKLVGGGSEYYLANGAKSFSCQAIDPKYMPAECNKLIGIPVKVCGKKY